MQGYTKSIPWNIMARYVKKPRIWELDFLRGLCVLLMILDHLAAMIAEVFAPYWYAFSAYDPFSAFCSEWMYGTVRPVIHNVVLVVFFGVSGISCTLSRSNTRRGTILMAVACTYSFFTLIAQYAFDMDGIVTVFGVLDFLAVCMLLYALVSKLCRGDARAISVSAVGITGITLILYFCYTPPPDTPLFFATVFPPVDAYGKAATFYSQLDFSPGDLFTMIPYTAYYFAGVLIAPYLYGNRESLLPMLDGKWSAPVRFVGRHALVIYVAHVALLALLLSLITFAFITPGRFLL